MHGCPKNHGCWMLVTQLCHHGSFFISLLVHTGYTLVILYRVAAVSRLICFCFATANSRSSLRHALAATSIVSVANWLMERQVSLMHSKRPTPITMPNKKRKFCNASIALSVTIFFFRAYTTKIKAHC